ncbi:MAG: hypothetical protein HFE73_03485 [Firmicutes bacterium]|nr:hypothetical protein [Bacillota bacterium]
MSKIYLSPSAHPAIIKYLESRDGHQVILMAPIPSIEAAINTHPDLIHCRLGIGHPVFHGNPDKLSCPYPLDAIYNGCATGKYFIHNLKYTDPALLELANSEGLTLVHVPQGYGRCCCLPVTENAIITADQGILKACKKAGLIALAITSGHVRLAGYPYGFIGGAAGQVGNEILFHGDLTTHPDGHAIRQFIESFGLTCTDFSNSIRFPGLAGTPLTDIGSIIEE